MTKPLLKTIALLGRDTGLAVLRDALLHNPDIELCHVYTHGKLTKAEGGAPREELSDYKALCREHNIDLTVLDYPNSRNVHNYYPDTPIDLMVVLSWKVILPPEALTPLQIGGINLHRGALPKYAGLEPVRRAIEAGEKRTAITAHYMIDDVDMGETISTVEMALPPCPSDHTSNEHAEYIKGKLLNLYAPLANLAIKTVISDYEEK